MNANSHPIKVVSVAGSGTDEMVANSHPIKVVEVADEGIYANDHPYKVVIEGPGPGPTPTTKDYGTLTMADYTYTLSAQSQDTTLTTITITDATKAEAFFRSRIGLLNVHNLGAQYNLFDGETHDYYVSFYSIASDGSNWAVYYSDGYGANDAYSPEELAQHGILVSMVSGASYPAYMLGIAVDLTFTGTTHTYTVDNLFDYYSLGTLYTTDAARIEEGTEVLLDLHGITYYKDAIREFTFGPDADFLPNEFLDNAQYLNSPIVIPSGITKIPNGFLEDCKRFNSSITVPSSVTEIGDNFLVGCSAFNQSLDLSNITRIGNGFMAGSQDYRTGEIIACNYNQALDLSSVTYIGNNFMYYNEALSYPNTYDFSSVEHIGTNFLGYTKYNNAINLSNCQTIGNSFLSNNTTFNSAITLRSSGVEIGNQFLSKCTTFNQALDVTNITKLGTSAFSQCSSFNQPLNFASLEVVNSMLGSADSFNSSISIPAAKTINTWLTNMGNFNQPLTIPASVTKIVLQNFLYSSNNYTNTITVNSSASLESVSGNAIATYNKSAPMYVTGVTIKGPYRSIWLTALPNKTSGGARKLIDGGE